MTKKKKKKHLRTQGFWESEVWRCKQPLHCLQLLFPLHASLSFLWSPNNHRSPPIVLTFWEEQFSSPPSFLPLVLPSQMYRFHHFSTKTEGLAFRTGKVCSFFFAIISRDLNLSKTMPVHLEPVFSMIIFLYYMNNMFLSLIYNTHFCQ